MAPGADALSLDALSLQNDQQSPPEADLRKMMSQHPLPVIPPGTVDPASMGGDEPTKQALAVLEELNTALAANDTKLLESCFYADQAYWKDQLALTYHMRTFASRDVIVASLLETKKLRKLTEAFELKGTAHFIPVTPVLQFIDCAFAFKTGEPASTCSGRLVLLPVETKEQETGEKGLTWKIWVLSTVLENLDVHPEDEALLKSPGKQIDKLETFEADVFIVGGGNAAAALAARLKTLGVESVMAERNPNPGDNWARRYDCMSFHIPTSFCDMPYMGYERTSHLLKRDELAGHLRRFIETFNLNIINSAEITETTLMPDGRWSVKFQTPNGTRTAIAKHLVQATGFGSQKPNIPTIADKQLYKGISIHSSQYKNAKELKKQGAKSVLIIGSANTAFDVLEDCHAAGLQTTMVVRSPTYLVPLDYVCHKFSLGSYDSGVEAADWNILTLPTLVDAQLAKGLFAAFASAEPDRYSALTKAGFPVIDSADPEMALMHNLIERAGGHYVDIGGTALLAEGKAGIKANTEPVGYTATGLRFSDGSTVDADAVIWCTGFSDKNASHTAAEIFKTKLPLDDTWGVDQEGEIRGMWKRHSRLGDNYWVMGGYTQQHRWFSRLLALQIKAALEGVLPPAYRDTPQPK